MKLTMYSRRWKHEDSYNIEKTDKGWHVSHIAIKGDCDKTGEPFLFENLKHDSINYPAALGEWMENLWDKSEGRDEAWIQSKLDVIGKWISEVEKVTLDEDFLEE